MAPLRLVAADHVAGAVHVIEPRTGRLLARLDGRHLAEHAGFLHLTGGRLAFVDDLAGELVVLDPFAAGTADPLVVATAPVAVPAEHLAADPSGRYVAVTSGCGRSWEPWSDLLTVADLGPGRRAGPGTDGPARPRSVRVRTRVGEPGVTLLANDPANGLTDKGGPLVVLRHRMPGSLDAYRLHELLDAAPGCPAAEPLLRLPLPDDGHGDAVDAATARVFAATGTGVHRARFRGSGLQLERPLPWDTPGHSGGRGYYLRLDAARRTLWSTVRGGPAEPGQWPLWTNDAWWHRLDEDTTGRVPLGPGLVFRLAFCADRVVFTRIHPDGDELIVVGADRPAVLARVPLPPMDGAPRRGGTPWDGVQRRAVAASPAAPIVAVTRGGHGQIHLFDTTTGTDLRPLDLPTPFDEGGHMAMVTVGDGSAEDTVGR
ncbi:YncE family protein [Spirillospora sp. CA-255316]